MGGPGPSTWLGAWVGLFPNKQDHFLWTQIKFMSPCDLHKCINVFIIDTFCHNSTFEIIKEHLTNFIINETVENSAGCRQTPGTPRRQRLGTRRDAVERSCCDVCHLLYVNALQAIAQLYRRHRAIISVFIVALILVCEWDLDSEKFLLTPIILPGWWSWKTTVAGRLVRYDIAPMDAWASNGDTT